MNAHEIHWDPKTRGFVLVHNHEMGPGTKHGWLGTEVTEDECAAIVRHCQEQPDYDSYDDIYQYIEGDDNPFEVDGKWFGSDGSSLYRVTEWCFLSDWREWDLLEELDAEWVGSTEVTIPICSIVQASYNGENPTIDKIGPLGTPDD